MNSDKLQFAITEAERFLQKAYMLRAETAENSWPMTGTVQTGAVRRASMDLTRALAVLRSAG